MRAPPAGRRGFTLIEVLVALAIMAVGTTAAIGLFTAATAMHKRALDQTTAALIADSALSDVRAAVRLQFDPRPLPTARAATADVPAVYYYKRDAAHPDFPSYVYDVLLTPIGTVDAMAADAFLAEVRVKWKASDKVVAPEFRTVILRRVTMRDLR